jgi:restriction endonuclease S subunit
MYGATIGKLGYLNIETTTNQACCVLGNPNTFSSKYGFYSFMNAKTSIISMSYGGGQPNISQDLVKSLRLSVPPLPEQTAIAAFLDRKTALIDQAIDIKQKQIELLKERRQILIHKAVTRGLNPNVKMKDSGVEWIGEIPEGWEVKRLKYVANLISLKQTSKGNSLNYIGLENIESWTGKYFSTETETEGLANYFKKGDILFGKLRPYLAKVYLAEIEGICSTEFLVFRSREVMFNWYLHLLMLSFEFIKLIDSSTYGSKMPRANSEFIVNQLIPIPSKEEQIEIVQYIEKATTKIDTAISLKEQEIEMLKEYKATLINSAVTGKIKVV